MRRPGTRHASNERHAPLLVRLYALLLWLYPVRFRREYGDEMLRVLRERVRDTRGSSAMLWLWGWALGDLLCSALAERMKAEVPMDAKVWSRVAGAAAILGGALAVILEIIFALPFFSGAGQTSEVAHFTTWSLNSGGMSAQYVLVPVLFFFVALVLAVRLWRRASRLVALGLALVFVGTLVRVLASLGPALYLPYIPLNALFNMTDGTATPLATFLANLPTYGQILLIPGLALLGIVLLRARLLLWGNWLLLSVGVLLLLYVIALTVGSSFIPSFYTWNVVLLVLSVLEGLAWVALGVSLWRSASRPAPVRVASAR